MIDARGRRVWPWPLGVAALAVLRDLPAAVHATETDRALVGLTLVASVAALVWLWARRAGTYYGTALGTAGLFALLPGHTRWVDGGPADRAVGMWTAVLLAVSYAAMGRGEPGRRSTIAIAAAAAAVSMLSWVLAGRFVPPPSLGLALLAGHALAAAAHRRGSAR